MIEREWGWIETSAK